MTEITTNARANSIQGLGSGLNTGQIINNLIQIEARRAEPIELRRDETQVELDSFDQVNTALEELDGVLETLASNSLWDAKTVESSDVETVTATATSGAQPGNYTLIVDRLALNHQIASQGFEADDTPVGTGQLVITVGEDTSTTVTIDEAKNTLRGLKDAINSATEDVRATLIRTGRQDRPFQLVLTSQKTGSEGRISLEIDLQGGEAPNFDNRVEETSPWAGVAAPDTEEAPALTDDGISTAIPRIIGDYTGAEDKTFTFTGVQTGTVGSDSELQLRWEDSEGQSGMIELDKFNYAPGEAVPFADGMSVILSEGDLVVGDSFTVQANAEKSSLFWWLSDAERAPTFSQPSRWERQRTEGTPKIDGSYTGEDDTTFTLTVEGSGQIGAASDLRIRYENEEGRSGVVDVGSGYTPGSQLGLIDGLKLSLNPGVLNEGDTATFEVTAEDQSGFWWKDDEERRIPPEIIGVTNFLPAEAEAEAEQGIQPNFPEESGLRMSTAEKTVSGMFTSDEAKVYTFTAQQDGTVGTTRGLVLRWEDEQGNFGSVDVGKKYEADTAVPFDAGLSIALSAGEVYEGDSFTVQADTSTVQPPQDALLRFGATELGGGLEVTSPTNEVDNVIDGVKLNLVSASPEPVTITIEGDTERAIETTIEFATRFNEFLGLVKELTKFDQATEEAGPLLSNSDLSSIKETLSSQLINPVAGLPVALNMVFTLGIEIDGEGLLKIDENEIREKIQADFEGVADLFRAKGESDNSGISVVGLTKDTAVSVDGYPVEISQLATRGEYVSPQLFEPILINASNNRFFISVDGRRSDQLSLPEGSYTVEEYAATLQNEIANDEVIGSRRVRVNAEDGALRVASGRYGENSAIAFEPIEASAPAGVGLLEGVATQGKNTAGTINGVPGEGLGQILRAPKGDQEIDGLRLFVKLGPNELNEAAEEARITVTKGVAARMGAYLGRVTDPLNGDMKRITDGLRSEVRSFDQQLNNITERIERRRNDLQNRFARLEGQLATMKSQQQRLQAQLSGLGGGGNPLPGLPTG